MKTKLKPARLANRGKLSLRVLVGSKGNHTTYPFPAFSLFHMFSMRKLDLLFNLAWGSVNFSLSLLQNQIEEKKTIIFILISLAQNNFGRSSSYRASIPRRQTLVLSYWTSPHIRGINNELYCTGKCNQHCGNYIV